jgi:hypothetical protein
MRPFFLGVCTMKNWQMPAAVLEDLRLRPAQLRGMVQRGKLIRNVHWAVIDGKRMYDLQAIKQWLAEQVPAPDQEPRIRVNAHYGPAPRMRL